MTPPDHDPTLDDGPLDDDTVAVNAVVDDEATAEQRRRVARDPELVARVADLRAAVAAVAAPVEPPGPDVLAALRARALDALDETDGEDGADEPDDLVVEPRPASDPPAPVRDLGAARARRSRSLPPLPAVAAVVVLLVLVGVGLIVAGSGGKGDTAADGGGASGGAEATAGETASAGDDAAADAQQELEEEFSERPADEVRDDLLARATARYATDAELVDELEGVDVQTYSLAGTTADAPTTSDDDEPDATTSPPSTTTSPPSTAGSGPESASAARAARAFAADPVATRCDSVLRSAEPDLDPAIAAVLVEVDGVPVLVLSNPTDPTTRAPEGIRLTALNAVDCSPRAAVVR